MPADFPAEQRRVAFRMGAAVAITVTAFAVTLPLTAGTPLPPIEQLAMAIRLDLFVALWLAIAIGDVARRRFLSPDDIAGSGTGTSTPGLAPASAFLSNTAEQVLLALPVHAALALALPRPLIRIRADLLPNHRRTYHRALEAQRRLDHPGDNAGHTTSPFRSISAWISTTSHSAPLIRYTDAITPPNSVVATIPRHP